MRLLGTGLGGVTQEMDKNLNNLTHLKTWSQTLFPLHLPIHVNLHLSCHNNDRLWTRYNLELRGTDLDLIRYVMKVSKIPNTIYVDFPLVAHLWSMVKNWWCLANYRADLHGRQVSHKQNAEINRLKQTLSEQLQEKESLMKTIVVLKNDFKKEESKNIDREIALEKKIKHMDNIVYKIDQSAQTVHMLTTPKFFYDHSTKQALGFQNTFYLKKARQLEPKLYDGNVIKNTCAIVIPDSEETLMLAEESHSKMIIKQQDLMVLENKVPKELPKVTMVNTSLKKKHNLTGFDVVVKERTTPTSITEGSWGFEHTKACFRDEIIPFVKALKDIYNTFDQYLTDELTEVQNVFHQMEQAVEQHRL
nr:reverse transcriptase domain, reverse transcriptase zinc-binding domain protein [Tanacetum cinerariifolium]